VCTLLSALFCGTALVGSFGPLKSSVIAMALYTVYVTGFACCCLQPDSVCPSRLWRALCCWRPRSRHSLDFAGSRLRLGLASNRDR
jgi:hypothetical protein